MRSPVANDVEIAGDDLEIDPVVAERAASLMAFKDLGRRMGVRVTDKMLAKAVKETWNDRTMVTWWKRHDPRCTPPHDRLIRAVLDKDPSSIWQPDIKPKRQPK